MNDSSESSNERRIIRMELMHQAIDEVLLIYCFNAVYDHVHVLLNLRIYEVAVDMVVVKVLFVVMVDHDEHDC